MEPGSIQTIIFGVNVGLLCLLVSEWLKLPSIILLLLSGILLGPYVLNLVDPQSLGGGLTIVIEVAVAVIIFEGAMGLNIAQFRSVSKIIRNVLTVGALITIIAITLMAHWVVGLPWGSSFVFGAIMSVTGPTVVGPILRRVSLKKPLGQILRWEAILLEPVGVILALLIVEFIISTEITLFSTLFSFLKMILLGGVIGGLFGFLFSLWLIKRPLANEGLRNLIVLGGALLVFQFSNMLVDNSGLVAVVVGGLFLGNSHVPYLEEIKQFKETITLLLISFLFVLLAANLNLDLFLDFSPKVLIFLGAVIFVIRPLNIFASTAGCDLNFRSKIYLSLIAPRGIVAASLASLFALVFAKHAYPKADILEVLAYQVIAVTVILNGLWAPLMAFLLKLREEEKKGYLIVGAHPLARGLAKWISGKGLDVALVDRDYYDVYQAKRQGLEAHKGDALDENFISGLELPSIGNLLALTSNDEVNTLACQLGKKVFGKDRTYQVHKELVEEGEETFIKAAGGKIVFPKLKPMMDVLENLKFKKLVLKEIKGEPPETFTPLFISNGKGQISPVSKDTVYKPETLVFGLEPKK